MDQQVVQALSSLNSFNDRVFFLPCSPDEVEKLQLALGDPLPDSYKTLLLNLGILQDLFQGRAHTIGGMCLSANRFHKVGLPAQFFPFAHAGEDVLLMRHEIGDQRVYMLPVDGPGVKATTETLDQFIVRCFDDMHDEESETRVTNEKKVWSVQFSAKTNDGQALLAVLNRAVLCEGRGTNWIHTHTSPAKVRCFSRKLKMPQHEIELGRMEYDGWDTPIFSFNWDEPVMQLSVGSVIKSIDESLAKANLGYILVDYGILPAKRK